MRVAASAAINRMLEDLLGKAQRDAPKEVGDLRASGTVEQSDPMTLVGQVVFASIYAAIQHERVDWQHDEGKAKYLEDHLKALLPGYERFIAEAVRNALRVLARG